MLKMGVGFKTKTTYKILPLKNQACGEHLSMMYYTRSILQIQKSINIKHITLATNLISDITDM